MILRTARITRCIAFVLLAAVRTSCVNATPGRITTHKGGYWKKLVIEHRINGLTVTLLTYYNSQPNGPVMSEIENHGKFEQDSLSRNGLVWFEHSDYSGLSFTSVRHLVKLRSRQIGYSKVKRLAGWPSDIHPFIYSPKFIPTKPPKYYAGKTTSNIQPLKRVGTDVFEGHRCLILQQLGLNLGNAGTRVDRFWWSIHGHIIWKEVDTIYPPANSPNPPKRSVTYLKWVRPMRRTPAQVFRFPAGTKVIVPGIIGNLKVPAGGTKIKPPSPLSPYIGVDLGPALSYFERTKGTPNEIHFYEPGHVPKNK